MQSGGGGGLARFRSAPATWLDALLEDEDAIKLAGSPNTGGLTQLLTAGVSSRPTPAYIPPQQQQQQDPHSTTSGFFDERESSGGGGGGGGGVSQSQSHHQHVQQQSHHHHHQNVAFQRMNSSPAEFLSGAVDGYFSGFGSSFDFAGSSSTSAASVDVSANVSPSGKRLRDLDSSRGEGQLSAAASGLLDMEMEKLFEDSVPCRVRAKRGCATHPRSIAERVRRTRISDRIRKLQELVPNMDKQTNTADMLEEAVEYVKTLQKQIQDLTEQQKNCTCLAKS